MMDILRSVSDFVEQLENARLKLQPKSHAQAAEVDAEIAAVKAVVGQIGARRHARALEVTRETKHEEILPRCVEAREVYERTLREFDSVNDRYLTAHKNLQYANSALSDHLAHPLQLADYPSRAERAAWISREKQLRQRIEEKLAEVHAAAQAQNDLSRRYREAKQNFDKVSFDERHLRRPGEEAVELVPVEYRSRHLHDINSVG